MRAANNRGVIYTWNNGTAIKLKWEKKTILTIISIIILTSTLTRSAAEFYRAPYVVGIAARGLVPSARSRLQSRIFFVIDVRLKRDPPQNIHRARNSHHASRTRAGTTSTGSSPHRQNFGVSDLSGPRARPEISLAETDRHHHRDPVSRGEPRRPSTLAGTGGASGEHRRSGEDVDPCRRAAAKSFAEYRIDTIRDLAVCDIIFVASTDEIIWPRGFAVAIVKCARYSTQNSRIQEAIWHRL